MLPTCLHIKQAIISERGIGALSKYLLYPRSKIVFNAVCTLRNLSDVIHKQVPPGDEAVADLVHRLVRLLDHSNVDVFTGAADILSNLTCTEGGKEVAFRAGCGPAMAAILLSWGMRTNVLREDKAKQLLQTVVATLRHITNGHPMVNFRQRKITWAC